MLDIKKMEQKIERAKLISMLPDCNFITHSLYRTFCMKFEIHMQIEIISKNQVWIVNNLQAGAGGNPIG